jgi:glycosidase
MSQYGDPKHFHRESGTMLGTILLTLPGTPFIYNGEEIGMTNVDYTSIDDFTDVWVKNYYKQAIKHLTKEQILSHLRRTSRNNARTPMQWNDQAFAGFSTHEPHQKNVGNYPLINVEKQMAEKDSILNTYKFLIRLRKESRYAETLIYGDFKLIHPKDPDVFAYTRSYYNQQIMVICNFSKETQDFTLPQRYKHVIFNNYQNAHIHKVLHLKPYEAMIVEV